MIENKTMLRLIILTAICFTNLGLFIDYAFAQGASIAQIPTEPYSGGMMVTVLLIIVVQLIDQMKSFTSNRRQDSAHQKMQEDFGLLFESQKSMHKRLDDINTASHSMGSDITTIKAHVETAAKK